MLECNWILKIHVMAKNLYYIMSNILQQVKWATEIDI